MGASFPTRGAAGAGSHFFTHIHPEGVCAGQGYGTASSSGAAIDSGRMEGDNLLNEAGNEKKCPSGTQDVFFKHFPSPGSTAGSTRGEVGCMKR